MNTPPKKIAILFFSRTAEAEGSHKILDERIDRSTNIAHTLIDYSYRQLQKTDYPVFTINEHQQKGHTFGERISNAFQNIFEKGYNCIIAVGNESPPASKPTYRGCSNQAAIR